VEFISARWDEVAFEPTSPSFRHLFVPTRAKERYGKDHFVAVNKRLDIINPIDVPEDFRDSIHQHYSFFLLTPEQYAHWFGMLRSGTLVQEQDE